MRSKHVAGFIVIGAMAFTVSAWSHHAHGNYAVTTVDIEGVVTELHLLNPHSWLYIEVIKADGQKQLWALEAAPRAALTSNGVTAEYMKVGDKVKVRCHPLTDGSSGCLLGFVKARDGSVKNWDAASSKSIPQDF